MKNLLRIAFFASGFAALLYQIIWQRMLTFFGGANIDSVTIIVSAFMAGLGFGSIAGAYLADRLTDRQCVFGFALSELAVGLFAGLSPYLFYDVLYIKLSPFGFSRAAMGAVVFITLLWPTFFMGLSLPLLARSASDAKAPSKWITSLYSWNTLGAALGALITVWVLFRTVDFRRGLWIGAVLNFGAAVLAFWIARRRLVHTNDSKNTNSTLRPDGAWCEPSIFKLPTWIAIYVLSGFVALSIEIVSFRILSVAIKSNSFTFGSLISVYLTGIGLGALLANHGWLARRSAAEMFFGLQTAIPVYVALSLTLLTRSVGQIPLASLLWDYFARYEPIGFGAVVQSLHFWVSGSGNSGVARELPLFVTLYGFLPLCVLGPPTLMMGMSFVYLQRLVQTDFQSLGRRVGWLQAANVIGSMLGTIGTGFVALHWLGSSGTLRLLVGIGAGLLLIRAWSVEKGRLRYVAVACSVGLAMAIVPSQQLMWASLHGTDSRAAIIDEDRSGVSLLRVENSNLNTFVYANGIGQSVLPYGTIHTLLGALPAMLHAKPKSVAVIGLGSADTLFGIGGREEIRTIDSVEIIAPELKTLRELDRTIFYPGLRMILQDERIHHWFTDGRMFLMRQPRRYDIIEADALRPSSAYSGNLYSAEYFQLLRDRLLPNGLAVTWIPTQRVLVTFLRVFPHVLVFNNIAIGSETPLAFDGDSLQARLRNPFTRAYYLKGQTQLEDLFAPYLAAGATRYEPGSAHRESTDYNEDLFPKDEFMIPSTPNPQSSLKSQ